MPKINKDKNGYYFRARFTDSNGKKHQKYKSGFKRKQDAIDCYINMYQTYQEECCNDPLREPFNEHIRKWFNSTYKRSVAETTAETRWYSIEKHILPYFHNQMLDNITARMIDEFYNDKLDEGLASKTVREYHNLLNRAFTQAIKWSLIKENPVNEATPPKIQTKEVTPWTKEQTETFLRLVKESEDEAFYVVAIFTGMRRGEILGLKWEDIDLYQGKIHVQRSLARVKGKGLILKDVKTKKSKRQIAISPYVVFVLKKHREKQLSWSKKMNGEFIEQGIVFSAMNGNLKDPNNQLRQFNKYIKQAGVPKVTIHDLRHLHATLMLKNGENPKVVSERLGHSRVGITLDIYSHVTPDLQDEAALRLEKSFFQKETE